VDSSSPEHRATESHNNWTTTKGSPQDPSAVPLRSAPSSVDDWAVAATGSLVVGLDNLSSISDKFSDCLCRASTGDGSVKRELFTDDELAILKFRRVVIINGIEVGALKGDLIERLLTVSMHRIDGSAKRSERDLNRDWLDMYPRVFGALLDLCVQVKAAMNHVNLETSPRMVDFATLLSAVDKVLGTDGLGLYLARSETLAQDSLSADPFLLRLRNAVGDGFVGTSAQLLNAVEKQIADASISFPRGWPRNAMEVTGRLKRNAPALRTLGWEIEHDEGKNKDGTLCWTIYPPSDDDPE
ncbi:MAG: ATP-binding protein, partial [Mycobacteriaceae bacterium]|nr:ATP-binding protein [Mycobacteriaceae bacterium]